MDLDDLGESSFNELQDAELVCVESGPVGPPAGFAAPAPQVGTRARARARVGGTDSHQHAQLLPLPLPSLLLPSLPLLLRSRHVLAAKPLAPSAAGQRARRR
jgi:hypothetical protein